MKKLYVAGLVWVAGHYYYYFDDFIVNVPLINAGKLKEADIRTIKDIVLGSYGKKLVAIFNIMELAD